MKAGYGKKYLSLQKEKSALKKKICSVFIEALFLQLSQKTNTLNFHSNGNMLQLAHVMALCGAIGQMAEPSFL